MDQEPTHHLSPQLQALLVKAKDWYDEHTPGLEAMSSDEIETSSLKGADLLMDIVEVMDREWGFAQPLPGDAP